jgi:hypothetical protein
LTAAFGNQTALASIVSTPAAGYKNNMDQHLPVADQALTDLLHTANISLDDPIVFTDLDLLPRRAAPNDQLTVRERQAVSTPTAWTPIFPLVEIVLLPDPRKLEYMERFAARSHLSGWLAEHAANDYHDVPWIRDPLLLHYRPTKTFENASWRLTWFEWSGS